MGECGIRQNTGATAPFFSQPPGLSQRPEEIVEGSFQTLPDSDSDDEELVLHYNSDERFSDDVPDSDEMASADGSDSDDVPDSDEMASADGSDSEDRQILSTMDECGIRSYTYTNDQENAKLGYINLEGEPAQPQFATEHSRLQTFSSWPPGLKQRPEEMANAGFYYVGRSDQVKCFYCDGGLQSWQPEDDVVAEHRKWFPTCVFMKLHQDPPGHGQQDDFKHAVSTLKKEENERPNLEMKKHSEGSISTTVKPEMKVVVENLEKEVEELRHQRSCKICLDKEVGVVFLPCSHLISCSMCATAVKNCPLCRSPIEQVIRTFLS